MRAFVVRSYGWLIVASCFLTLMVTFGTEGSFGVLFKPMISEFGWDRASLSLAVSIAMIFYGISQTIMGRLADQLGPRVIIAFGGLMVAVGIGLLATATEIWQVYVYFGVIAAIGYGGVAPVTMAALVARWFTRRRALALSIATTGLSAGTILVIPAAMYMVLQLDWRWTAFILAVVAGIVVLPLAAFVIRSNPGDVGGVANGADRSDAADGAVAAEPRERRVPASLAIRQRSFWQLSVGLFVCGFTWSLVMTHFIPFALDLGIPEMLAANALSLTSSVAVVGSIGTAALSDKYGRSKLLGLVYFLRGSSFFMLPWVTSVPMLYVFAVVHGTGRLASVPLSSALTGDLYGRRSVGTVFGMIYLIHQVGASLGSYVGGVVYDLTGSYLGAFLLAAVMGLVATATSASIDEKRKAVDLVAIEGV
ncbi:MAG: MFS transporter [Chloroflexi bacterium]|nr:MFS transporter [Chloroflexota bacterium]